ncbi:anti-sigma factor [Paractinoplanes atraurantiacus]|uniref:Regulator of SigK n=1 Tax=Paractinoplanes atraurantiacus TaxID=1036182 RepID=A0A285GJP0_9ACTN|nr:anti-sigma factor [Actinoplanes atraurantiacus]SNY23424.1 Putative zinc-finger [Actinoplanes atraurantiacus]
MRPDVHSLVGAYVLDAVDDLERVAFERHLRECEDCRAEVGELRETAARLADAAWSVPPPSMRANVLREIGTTRQEPAAAVRPVRPQRRLHLVAAAAVVVAAVGAGAAVYVLQDQRVRDERAVAEAARASEARVRAILAAPDLQVREQPLTSGGRVTVASSKLTGAGVIMLAASSPPGDGRVYQLWTIRDDDPTSAGALGEDQAATVRIVEGLPASNAVGVTIETAPGATSPTMPLDALVPL